MSVYLSCHWASDSHLLVDFSAKIILHYVIYSYVYCLIILLSETLNVCLSQLPLVCVIIVLSETRIAVGHVLASHCVFFCAYHCITTKVQWLVWSVVGIFKCLLLLLLFL